MKSVGLARIISAAMRTFQTDHVKINSGKLEELHDFRNGNLNDVRIYCAYLVTVFT